MARACRCSAKANGPELVHDGDRHRVVFFRDGAHARWHVEGRVKKLAFCRKTQPMWLGFALRVVLKLRKILMPSGARQPASLMGAG
jgi:hypothetical protein